MLGNILEQCEHYWHCSHPLYTGECMEECFKRYEKEMHLKEKDEKKVE